MNFSIGGFRHPQSYVKLPSGKFSGIEKRLKEVFKRFKLRRTSWNSFLIIATLLAKHFILLPPITSVHHEISRKTAMLPLSIDLEGLKL